MAYPVPEITSRYSIRDYILTLDPVKDHQQICYLSSCYDFPWDFTRALEFALFRTFGVAKGTPLLQQTGEFIRRTRKRYDDTVLILGEILENGYDSPRGKAALRRMNQQHARYSIGNDEYLYTLSTFVLEPIRWMERFGWRPYTNHEKTAAFTYWLEMGKRMNIRDLPNTLEEMERFNVQFEREHFRYTPSNEAIATPTRDLLLSMYLPRWLWPVGKPFVYALIDEPLLRAVGFPNPPAWLRRVVEGGLRLKARIQRLWAPRKRPYLFTAARYPSYPGGYQIEQLGADRG
ncbi:oxygenase MpaB family protein [Meiothermus sp.]|uniref:oxygenase MpaB family protein n=1 Tax=Meiothermus sp. TaxID=1955249 RepID=UPI00307CCDE0